MVLVVFITISMGRYHTELGFPKYFSFCLSPGFSTSLGNQSAAKFAGYNGEKDLEGMAEPGRCDRITGSCGGEIVKLNTHMLTRMHLHTAVINGGGCGDL